MKITAGKQSFDSIKQFTDYLKTYKHDEKVSKEVSVAIESEGLDATNLNELVVFILNPETPYLFQINLISQEKTVLQLALNDAYLVSKKQRFSQHFQKQVTDLVEAKAFLESPINKIRKSKKNWIEGVQGATAGLQLQQQQQQQRQQQQSVPATKRKNAPFMNKGAEKKPAAKVSSNDLGSLIERSNLISEFNAYTQELYGIKAPDLLHVWDQLVGENVDKINILDRKITHVQKDAMEMIISSYPEFAYGLVFENLPEGFSIKETEDGKNVLCYTHEPTLEEKQRINPLSITFASAKTATLGSYQQFALLKKNSPNSVLYESEFKYLTDKKTTAQRRLKALTFFLEEVESDNKKLELIQKLMTSLPLNNVNYEGLAQVFIHYGADGVLLLLQELKTLQAKELLDDFNEQFLDDPRNYLSLITDAGFAHLKRLAELTREQKSWWLSLVAQHKAAGARTEFNDLFAAYDYFLREINHINTGEGSPALTLPLSCPLENITNIKPALDRVLFIIKHSGDPEEQLMCLDGLDYGPHGAYFASRYNGYQIVSKQMGLTPQFTDKSLDYSLGNNLIEATLAITTLGGSYNTSLRNFYRYIGMQRSAYSFDIYHKLESYITNHSLGTNQNLVQTKAYLLNILAFTGTGQRIFEDLSADPVAAFSEFIERLIALSSQIDRHEDSDTALLRIVFSYCAHLTQNDPDSMPIFDELNQLWDVILLSLGDVHKIYRPSERISQVLPLAFSLINRHHAAAISVIDNYKRRVLIEQSNTTKIEQFNFYQLLDHLSSRSRISEFYKDYFTIPSQTLDQFIVLLSLCRDYMLPVSRDPARPDSAFEINVKTLIPALTNIQEDHRLLLLAILTDINIEASYRLPSLMQLIEIAKKVQAEQENLHALGNVDAQKEQIQHYIEEFLPDIKIGNVAVKETDNSLLKVLKQSLDELDLETLLKKKSEFSALLESHQQLMSILSEEPLNAQKVLAALVAENNEISSLLSNYTFKTALSASPKLRIELTRILFKIPNKVADKNIDLSTINEFIDKKSIIVLLGAKLTANYHSSIAMVIKSLQTANKEFDAFLMRQIPKLNASLPVDIVLMQADKQVRELNDFVNALIRLKNKDSTDFCRSLRLIAEQFKTDNSKKTSFTLDQISHLLNILDKPEVYLVSDLLDILFTVLKKHPHCSSQQLQTALNEVDYLVYHRKQLAPEAYATLLRLSFKHNVSQTNVFPLQQMMQFNNLIGIKKDESEALFNTLISLIKNVDPGASPGVDDALLKEVIDNTTSIINIKAPNIPELVPLLTLLMKTCRNSTVHELRTYYSLVNRLEQTKDKQLISWTKILLALGKNAREEDIPLLLRIQAGLEVQTFYLEDIDQLFTYPPYPNLQEFLKVLEDDAPHFKAYIDKFDKDPKSKRVPELENNRTKKSIEQVLDEQFDASRVKRVVKKIQQLITNSSLTSEEQYELAQQVTYINAIGRSQPLVICHPDSVSVKTKISDLTQLTRTELGALSDYFIAAVRKQNISEIEKTKAQLNLLAVLREQYFRATGRFAYSTQILSVLMSLKNHNHNMLMEIDSGEGKSITTALLAVMQWVEADGGSVDVCTANKELIAQDFIDSGNKDFFTSLKIKSSYIEADSLQGTYLVDGINYSTIGDLALYRARAKLGHENLIAKKNGHPLSSNLILDESDFSALEDRTLFNLAISPEGGGDGSENPYAWIYPLINDFINQKEFKNVDPQKAWSEEQDLSRLKVFLDKKAPTGAHKIQLQALPDRKFNLWINSAIDAQRRVEGLDFEIFPAKNGQYVAIPYNLKVLQPGLTFSNGVQQFLHARLQKEYADKGWKFPIEPEMLFIDMASAKDLIDDYKEHGRVIGISGTLGTKNELIQQRDKLNFAAMYQMPPHLKNQRDDLGFKVVKNKVEYLKKIKEAINMAQQEQPLVIIARDANEIKYLAEQLKKQYGDRYVIHSFTGKESPEERQNWMKKHAGKNNTITIETPLMGHDYITKNKFGFLCIQTYLDSSRTTRQIIDRVARNGSLGQYIAVYENAGLWQHTSWFFDSKKDLEQIENEVERLQKRLNEVVAVKHYYVHSVSGLQQVVMKQFEEWQAFLQLVYPEKDMRQLNNELIIHREDLIRALTEKWQELLDASDPEKKYPNPYERRKNGKLQTADLDEALEQFKTAAIEIWNKKRTELKAKAKKVIIKDSLNELRFDYLSSVSLSAQFTEAYLAARKIKKEHTKEKKKAQRHVAAAIDVHGAMWRYSAGDNEAHRFAFESSQTKLFRDEIVKIIENNKFLSKTERKGLLEQIDIAQTLQVLALVLNTYVQKRIPEEHYEQRYKLQPIIHELLRSYKELGYKETENVQKLRELYLDDVTDDLVVHLKMSLSWAIKGNRGLGYKLERTKVTNAADEILLAIKPLEVTTNLKVRQKAIRNLYKVLAYHQEQLEGLWIFSFGHKNTRTLIKQTLATLDGLTSISSGEEQLDAEFIRDCKEDALDYVMRTKFDVAIKKLDHHMVSQPAWEQVKAEIKVIQDHCASIYSFDEVNYYLDKKIEQLTKKAPDSLFSAIKKLKNEISRLRHERDQSHYDLIDNSKYFALKSEQIKDLLVAEQCLIDNVQLKAGHNGFSDYFELVIEGQSASHPMLAEFIPLETRVPELTRKVAEVNHELKEVDALILDLQKMEREQLPLLKSTATKAADPEAFQFQYRKQVKHIQILKSFATAHPKEEELDWFTEEEKAVFADRDLIHSFKYDDLQFEEIKKIKNLSLRDDLIDLFDRKIIAEQQSRSLWNKAWTFAAGFVITQEDRTAQLEALKERANTHVKTVIDPVVDAQQQELSEKMSSLAQEAQDYKIILNQRKDFFDEKMIGEKAKGGIYYKRFNDINEFYAFEEKYCKKTKDIKKAPADKAKQAPASNGTPDETRHSTSGMRL